MAFKKVFCVTGLRGAVDVGGLCKGQATRRAAKQNKLRQEPETSTLPELTVYQLEPRPGIDEEEV